MSVSVSVFEITNRELPDAMQLQNDLQKALSKIGISFSVHKTDAHIWMAFNYDMDDVNIRLSRNAGKYCKTATAHSIDVSQCLARMNNGEIAADIAKEYGISRMTLFRRLKKAKEQGLSEIDI